MAEEHVETVPTESAPAPTTTPSAASTEAAPTATVDPWTGELTTLQNQPWWASIPEEARGQVTPGIERIYKGWQSSYTRKNQELADQRKAWETEKTTWEQERDARNKELDDGWEAYNLALFGEKDPHEKFSRDIAERDAQLTALKSELEALKAAKATGEVSTPDFNEERQKIMAEVEAVKAQLAEATTKATEWEGKYTEAQKAQQAAFTETVYSYMEANAKDVLEDDEAYELAMETAAKGDQYDLEKGIRAGRALLAAKSGKPQPEPFSPSERAATIGSPGPSRITEERKPMTVDEVAREQLRKAGLNPDHDRWQPGR